MYASLNRKCHVVIIIVRTYYALQVKQYINNSVGVYAHEGRLISPRDKDELSQRKRPRALVAALTDLHANFHDPSFSSRIERLNAGNFSIP